jgi:Rab5 GDP/GTP exchange factor
MKKRFRQLRWVCPGKNLKFPIDVFNPQVQRLIYAAIRELDSMDALKLPEEKMNAIRRCCIILQELIKQHTGHGMASADSLMPAMIFVVLQAYPLHLHSNINYITRFRNQRKLDRGEAAYYFTTLVSLRIAESYT